MRIKGILIHHIDNVHKRMGDEVTVELSPREFLEQMTHKQISELLEMINLPQPQQEFCECKPDKKGQLPVTPGRNK